MQLTNRPLLDNPVDEDLFVGRRDELDRIHTSVRAGVNTLVLGERGSGKTSLLRRVQAELRSAPVPQHVVFCSAQNASNLVGLIDTILWHTLHDHPQTALADRMSAPEQSSGQYGALDALDRLASAFGTVEHAIVLLDDVGDPELVHGLFGRFRDEVWAMNATWVVAGDTQWKATYLSPPADAFFQTLVVLGPLSTAEATQLVRSRIDPAGPDQLDQVMAIASEGGQPRRLVSAAKAVFVDGRDAEEMRTRQANLELAAVGLGRPATMLLSELHALGPVSASDERLLRRMGWTRTRAVQVLRLLVAAGLVDEGMRRESGSRPKKMYWAVCEDQPS